MYDKKKAWDDYWQTNNSSGMGCLPGSDEGSEQALSSWWSHFAKGLPRKCRHVDLASGNGVVIRKMLKSRPDLRSVGIDAALSLPPPGKGFKLRSGVSMEAMPFTNKSIDVVTSQFGIEYGDKKKIGAEIARILTPNGQFAFVVHNADGPIVTHNMRRLESLIWVLEEQQLISRACNWVSQKAIFGISIPSDFQNAPSIAAGRFGQTSAAAELSTAILQCLTVGKNLPINDNLSMLNELLRLATGEAARIQSLHAAALTADQIHSFCRTLVDLNLKVDEMMMFSQFMAESDDIAWIVSGRN